MSWRFARRPSWVVRHLVVLAAVVAMINLGFWQLDRMRERQDQVDLLTARQQAPVADVRELVPAGTGVDDAAIDEVSYRRVEATGTYDHGATVLVGNRSLDGVPGGWVLTPLRFEDGTAVVVNRGFVGFDRAGVLRAPEPPAGSVTVQGLVHPSEQRGRFGPTDPEGGRLDELARADIRRLAAQVPYDVLGAFVQLERSDPPEPAANPTAVGDAPQLVALGPPERGTGPHLSYAVQWFVFSAIALLGYPLLLRRVAMQEAAERRRAALDEPSREPDELDRELEQLLRDE